MDNQLTLWGVKVSPYVRKVMVALNEKELPYTHEEILPTAFLQATKQDVPASFAKISPLGRIPALQDNGFAIADSAVICAYLDKKYPNKQALYPSDPEQYAKTIWFEHYGDEILTNVIYRKIFVEAVAKPLVLQQATDQSIVDQAISEELPPLLTYLEEQIGDKQWLIGDNYSAADIAVATHFLSLQQANVGGEDPWPKVDSYLQQANAGGVDPWPKVDSYLQQADVGGVDPWPKLDSYLKRVFARDAWQKVIKD